MALWKSIGERVSSQLLWMSRVRWTQGKVSGVGELGVSSSARRLFKLHHLFHWLKPWHYAFRVPAKDWSTVLTGEPLNYGIVRKIYLLLVILELHILPLISIPEFVYALSVDTRWLGGSTAHVLTSPWNSTEEFLLQKFLSLHYKT